jgi:hypothetical protein
LRLAFAYLRRTQCPRGRHFTGGNYCAYGCGALLVKEAGREWTLTLSDGSSLKVQATNEAHARGLVVYGDVGPGRVDLFALAEERIKVHEDNIVSCKPGQGGLDEEVVHRDSRHG